MDVEDFQKIQPGHCWASGKEIAEILYRYPQDHPLAGNVNRVGRCYDFAVRVTFLQVNGRTVDLVIHEDHLDEIDLNKIWGLLLVAENADFHRRQLFPGYDEEQALDAHTKQLALLSPLIGILCMYHVQEEQFRITL